MIVKCDAFILNKIPYKNTSLIVNFYTSKFGKITALVKGANRKNKYNSNFDLFSLNEVIIYKRNKNSLSIVSECNLLDSYSDIKKDIHKISYCLYFMELVNMASEQEDANIQMYKLSLLAFKLFSLWDDFEKIRHLFETRLLFFSGLMPRIDGCLHCGKSIIGKTAYFSSNMGGLLCPVCEGKDKNSERLMPSTVLAVNKFLKEDLLFLERVNFSEKVSLQLKRILTNFLNYQFGRSAKSLEFLNLTSNIKKTELKQKNQVGQLV